MSASPITPATAQEFKLPDVGEGLTEAEIVVWRVAVGDVVKVNDIVVEIETAKSIVELPSPYAGEVLALMVEVGETVEVGTPIIRIGEPGAAAPAAVPAAAPAAPAAAPASSATSTTSTGPEIIDTNIPPTGQATLVGYGPKQRDLKRRARRGDAGLHAVPAPAATPAPAAPAAPVAPLGAAAARALAKPLVRRLARDLGVDLAACTPTGPRGTVSKDDVLALVGAGSAAPAAPLRAGAAPVALDPAGRETREPVKGVRKQMAAAMVASAYTAPHVTEWTTIDATATVQLVERLKARREFDGLKISPLLIAARACVLAMRRSPLVNSTWDEAAQEVVVKHYVNLGIAAATPRGLVVPNVKDADTLSLPALAEALGGLTATAREGRTQPADLAGGTFTITNVGVFGVDGGTPIINPGESAILCLGAIKKQPWVVGEEIVARDVMTLSLSFDHRHIDGATGSRFLADVADILADPATALLF